MLIPPDLRETPFSEKTIFQGKIIRVCQMEVSLPNGQTSSREIVYHHGGVGVVAVDAEGMVTLVRQHRIAVNALTLEIPAGKLDASSEDPMQAAHRELEEETGLRAEQMTLLTATLPTPGYCTERLYIYLAAGLSRHDAHLDADEFLSVTKIPFSEALRLVMTGEITDAKTIIGLLMAKEKLHAPQNA